LRPRSDGGLDLPFQEADRFAKVADRNDLQASNDSGLSSVLRRNSDSHLALLARAQGNGQHPFDNQHRPASATSHAVGLLDN
jgi:hypothetical protein